MSDATRDSILAAARRLFVEHGFAGASLSDIAAAAGVTKSLIHHHFGSKQGLWDAMKEECAATYTSQLAATLAAQPPDVGLLKESLASYYEFLRRNPDEVRLFAWLFLEGKNDCPPGELELLRLGAERLRDGQAQGTIRGDLQPGYILAVALCSMVRWFQNRELFQQVLPKLGVDQLDDGFRDTLLTILIDGVVARPPVPPAPPSGT